MSNIVINDLTESMELDNQAMQTIMGGSRASAKKVNLSSTLKKHDSSILANVIGNEKLRSVVLCC